ncbi:MAG: Lytic murein transglycosylase, partial [Tardiphaga sp.]|nr:Lytic murein transglycosylase [Tardiphaga sp.]
MALVVCSPTFAQAAPDPAFARFVASLWPDAQAAGVSRATFETLTAGLEPDYKLPDLLLPGRP